MADWSKPVNYWRVTTEGDEEGRSSRDLGIHYGHLAEIAMYLARSAFYGLKFEPVSLNEAKKSIAIPGERPVYTASANSVNVSLSLRGPTFTSDISPEARASWFRDFLDTEDIKVSESNYFNCVELSMP